MFFTIGGISSQNQHILSQNQPERIHIQNNLLLLQPKTTCFRLHNMTTDNNNQHIALFQGSFDPFTAGHESIVRRALDIFDKVVVAVVHNIGKPGFLPVDRRVEIIEQAFAGESRVEVVTSQGLTVDLARQCGATCLLRGVRTVQDFEYEMTMAAANRHLSGGTLETVMLYSLPELAHVSSSLVRELVRFNQPVEALMPSKWDRKPLTTNENRQ